MQKSPLKIGLLPLYLELYDRVKPQIRAEIEPFAGCIARELQARQVEVTVAPVCRIHDEVARAITSFTNAGVDAVVTLHLAYSPSLETAELLANSGLPVVILDTTPTFGFNFDPTGKIMPNHGIHGVQDLCNLLGRHNRNFLIAAGHWQNSDVLDRTVDNLKSARLARAIRQARVGLIGNPFPGMGDFAVPFPELAENIGITVHPFDSHFNPPAEAGEIDAELQADRQRFIFGKLSPEAYQRSIKASLRVRKWLRQENLHAFSFNFQDISARQGWESVPFLECCKAMARGIGYAGEGDVLSAALVGALLQLHPETTFTEMFCPDWQNNLILLSHMGELNPELLQSTALLQENECPFCDTGTPAFAYGTFKPGPATLINLAPLRNNRFRLLACPGSCFAPGPDATPTAMVAGWFKPRRNLPEFLELYSQHHATHHCALCYNLPGKILAGFAHLMNWDFAEI